MGEGQGGSRAAYRTAPRMLQPFIIGKKYSLMLGLPYAAFVYISSPCQ